MMLKIPELLGVPEKFCDDDYTLQAVCTAFTQAAKTLARAVQRF